MHPLSVGVLLFSFVILWTVVYQMIVPLLKGQRMFPIFKPSQKLEGELADVLEKTEEKKIRKEIEKLSESLKQENKNNETKED